jgi:hypothetical protein
MRKDFFKLDTTGIFDDDVTYLDENGDEYFIYHGLLGETGRVYTNNPITKFISLFYRGVFYFFVWLLVTFVFGLTFGLTTIILYCFGIF